MRPLQISPETALALSKQLGVPLEHLMHMPQHILMQKIAELAKKNAGEGDSPDGEGKNEA
ncbi:YycC family protein [Paenibacillus sp. HN-1]|uniref:YycC family protein n=1 Tax=Paenibacillus TaxID=44249 RepID=UPI001CA8B1A7|nr:MULTISPECIES: YycC family protein [Paenibacillus]MBY9078886.1 YycC family protein [Paenibacillus sp. CGMCC 1.18879]MBY9082872.1 YycC family protein [Paenibacillus sinensis]